MTQLAPTKTMKRKSYGKRSEPAWAKRARLAATMAPRRTIVPSRSIGVLGNSLRTKMKYVELGALNAGTAGTASVSFTANGVYDPFTPIGGHQPYRFDQLTQFYNHFTVVKSKAIATIMNNSGYRVRVVLNTYDSSSSASSKPMNTLIEHPGASFAYLDPDSAGTGKSNVVLRKSCDVGRFFGKSMNSLIDSALYRGSATSDPSEQVFFTLTYAEDTGLVDPGQMQYQMLIEYDVVWTEPRREDGS